MTRKDYEKIAAVLRELFPMDPESDTFMVGYNAGIRYAARDTIFRMAAMLRNENPRFDEDKFLKACGVS